MIASSSRSSSDGLSTRMFGVKSCSHARLSLGAHPHRVALRGSDLTIVPIKLYFLFHLTRTSTTVSYSTGCQDN